ncbi:hypothetical protein [Tenacibaculum amylolyticum]|uniref:hypothetical protein n=1 Tax=Tenacibaculum amylolyticum TaxID=104269 RepID=UPI003895055A
MEKKLSYILVTFLCIILLNSCTNEDTLLTNAKTETTTKTKESKRSISLVEFCYDETTSVNASLMTSCADTFSLNNIINTLSYDGLGSAKLDTTLKSLFYCHEDFSTCMGAPKPIKVCSVEFSIYDGPNFNETYDYLSDTIPPTISNQIKQYFACTIKTYGDTNYSNYRIANVHFFNDYLLCNDCSSGLGTRFLKAKVSYYVY